MTRPSNWLTYSAVSVLFIIFIVGYLMLFGDYSLFVLTGVLVYCFAIARAFNIYSRKRMKAGLMVTYTLLLMVEFVSFDIVVFNAEYIGLKAILAKLSGIVLILSPFILERITTITNHTVFAVPSLQEAGSVSYAVFNRSKEDLRQWQASLDKLSGTLKSENVRELVEDLPRHNSLQYINEGSLTSAWFDAAEATLADPYVYIVVSNTGSAASELISVFTRKQFNHVSFSFDEQLETILSYNGGEKVYPPGMNAEMMSFFNQKPDASVGVYRLSVSRAQKQAMLDKIREINQQGSAYNLIGLVFKYSHRPNIMFCSQFVYNLLHSVDLHYFDKRPELVQPTDFVELDYFRKLEFVRLLTFK